MFSPALVDKGVTFAAGSFFYWSRCPFAVISDSGRYFEISLSVSPGQQKQRPAAAAAENVTPLYTNAGENTSEVLLQIFDPTETIYSDLTGKFTVQSDRGNNYILVAYHYDANNILNLS